MDTTFLEFCQRIGKDIGPHPFCVETGAAYNRLNTPQRIANLVNVSTYNMVWHIAKPNAGMVWTYDNQQESLDICQEVLGEDVRYWKPVLGDSVEQLSKGDFPKSIDFVYFDSAGDTQTMVNEFEAVEPYLSLNAVVCCDDIHNSASVKWVEFVPLIQAKARYSLELSTSLGTYLAFMGETLGGY